MMATRRRLIEGPSSQSKSRNSPFDLQRKDSKSNPAVTSKPHRRFMILQSLPFCLLFGAALVFMNMFDSSSLSSLWSYDDSQSLDSSQTTSSSPHSIITQKPNLEPNQQIRELRIKRPPQCPNSAHRLFPINSADHNWAPYYFRCNDLLHGKAVKKTPWMDAAIITKELFYVHVFKAGGTTIIGNVLAFLNEQTFNPTILQPLTPLGPEVVIPGFDIKNYSKTPDAKYSQHSILDNFIENNTTTFSFVRDPVDKFLSGFYEVNRRVFVTKEIRIARADVGLRALVERYGNKSGIEIMRSWMKEIERRTADFIDPHQLFMDPHLLPNMHFLMDQHYQTRSIPFNFIGNLKHFAEDFPQILHPFIRDQELRRNHSKIMDLMIQKRVRSDEKSGSVHSILDEHLTRFLVKRSQLSDDDIRRICDLYWLDYMCFPFDLPAQCDLNELIEKHYGVDIEYRDCY